MSESKKLLVYGADWCADCLRVKNILAAQSVEYTYMDTEDEPTHQEMLKQTGGKAAPATVNEILKQKLGI